MVMESGYIVNVALSTMFYWYALFDIRGQEVDDALVALLDPNGVEIRFPELEMPIRSTSAFVNWYRNAFPLVTSGTHRFHPEAIAIKDGGVIITGTTYLDASLATGARFRATFRIIARLLVPNRRLPHFPIYYYKASIIH